MPSTIFWLQECRISGHYQQDKKTLSGLHENSLTRAQDFEAATKSRAEELKALARAFFLEIPLGQ